MTDPGGWQVAVRWLPWRPRWRPRPLEWWIGDLLDFDRDDDQGLERLLPPAFKIAIGLLLGTTGLLVIGAFWVAVGAGAVGALFARVVLLQPFLVEATHPAGEWAGWWVVGWRKARATRTAMATALRDGTPVDALQPDHDPAATSTATPDLPGRFDDANWVLGVVRGVLLVIGVLVAGATWAFARNGWIVAVVLVMLVAIAVMVVRETGDR